jgi:hypothetical protein
MENSIVSNSKSTTSKQQSRKIGVAGGFMNQLMGNNQSIPVIGEGATILHYSDRSAYEVIEVSPNGHSCVIRSMDTTWCGLAYGDEQYTYQSNPENGTQNIEWNAKKQQWQSFGYSVQLIKSLREKLFKQHGWKFWDNLPNGLTGDDLYIDIANSNEMKLVDGVTKLYKNTSPVSIIFGTMDEYRDPSF